VVTPERRDELVASLARAGCVAAGEEADELLDAAGGDPGLLDALAARRRAGEPLAWVVGRTRFCGLDLRVDRGVYVPRPQSEPLARRAVERLADGGVAVDLCTGSGALGRVLTVARPRARVVGTDLDPRAVSCAAANGVDARQGDLFDPLSPTLLGRVDVVTGVVPYVPTASLGLLPRDTLTFESPLAYDGGADGTDLLVRAVAGAPAFLRPGGALLLELGGDQAELLAAPLARHGFGAVVVGRDEEGDVRSVEATLTDREAVRMGQAGREG
jgi:release factor glutamine methyltransferase